MANKRPLNFKQSDRRWGRTMYSSVNDPAQTIATSGCGPTAMADIIALWDPKVTPKEMCAMAQLHGFRTRANGTSRAFFEYVAKVFGARFVRTSNTNLVKKLIEQGGYAVANMGHGYFTAGTGHYVCLWWYNRSINTFYVCDPASRNRTAAGGSVVAKERKEFFVFFK